MIDASIVQGTQAVAEQGGESAGWRRGDAGDWKPAKRRQKATDARWTKKHGKSYFGYKVSVNADNRCKLVRKIKVSIASDHDTMSL